MQVRGRSSVRHGDRNCARRGGVPLDSSGEGPPQLAGDHARPSHIGGSVVPRACVSGATPDNVRARTVCCPVFFVASAPRQPPRCTAGAVSGKRLKGCWAAVDACTVLLIDTRAGGHAVREQSTTYVAAKNKSTTKGWKARREKNKPDVRDGTPECKTRSEALSQWVPPHSVGAERDGTPQWVPHTNSQLPPKHSAPAQV